MPTVPGPVPGQEDTTHYVTETIRLLSQSLWNHSQPAVLPSPSWYLLPWVHLTLVLPETIPSFPTFPMTKAEELRMS